MSGLSLFLGQAGQARLLKADEGFQDAGLSIPVRLETVPVSPAGPGGEAIFTALWVVITHTMAATVQVTPIVDGATLETQSILLTASTNSVTEHLELGLSLPWTRSGVGEVGRVAPRGTWFQVRLSIPALAAGDLIIEGVAVEYEVVRESIRAQTVTP